MSRSWTQSKDNPLAELDVLVAAFSPWQEAILGALQSAGITPQTANTPEEAIHFLKFQQPGFLLLTENFCSHDDPLNPILDYIQKMAISLRRELFVVFISPTTKSGDHLSAFSHSVNLMLHPDTLQNLVAQITESWISWKNLYQIFFQTRHHLTG